MSNLSIKDYNQSMKEKTNYRDILKEQLYHYKNNLNMSEQLDIADIIRKVNKEIIELEERFKKSLPENFKRKKGFDIDHEKKLQELDVKYKTLANETRGNLPSEERDLISKALDKFLETRTQILKEQQKEISGRGKNRKRKITKKRKHKKRKTKKRKPKNKHKTKKR